MGGPQCCLLTEGGSKVVVSTQTLYKEGTADRAMGAGVARGQHGDLHADLGVFQSDVQIIQGLLHLLCVLNQGQVLFL